MIGKKLARKVWLGVGAFTVFLLTPALAFAAEEAAAATDYRWGIAKAISAGAVMSFSALSAGYAQAKIGSAGAGTLAERPEVATNIIVLQALPEIIALLGFVIAFMIGTAA